MLVAVLVPVLVLELVGLPVAVAESSATTVPTAASASTMPAP